MFHLKHRIMKKIFTFLVASTLVTMAAMAAGPRAYQGQRTQSLAAIAGKSVTTMNKAPRLAESPIMNTPEGTLHDNMYATSEAYGLGIGDVYTQKVDGGIGKVVEASDGSIYIYGLISQGYIWFSAQPWVKASKQSDGTYAIQTPVVYIEDYGELYYLHSMNYDSTTGMPEIDTNNTPVTFTWENGVLTQTSDNYLGLCDTVPSWFYMADTKIVYKPQTDVPVTVPDKATQSYKMTYLSDADTLTKTAERPVEMIIDGSDIYLGAIEDNLPNAYIKGTIADGKVTFPSKQYLGIDTYYGGHVYAMMGDAYVEGEEGYKYFNYTLTDKIEMTYDATTGNIQATYPASIVTNVGKETLYIIGDYVGVNFTAMADDPATPADPIMDDTDVKDVSQTSGFYTITVTIPKVDVNGNELNENKLYYNVYVDGEKFTFTPSLYSGLSADLLDVPYGFEDTNNWDIYKSGERRKIYLYVTSMNSVGVQSIYRGGNEEHRSNIVTVYLEGTGLNDVNAAAQVVGEQYYDLTGRSVDASATGLIIKRVTYSDGTVNTMKVLK